MEHGITEMAPEKAVESKKERSKNMTVYGLFLVTLVFVGKVQELVEPLSKISIGKIVIVLSLMLYFMSPKNRDAIKLFSIPQIRNVAGIYFLGIASIPLSVWPGISFQFVFFQLTKTFIFFNLIVITICSVAELKKLNWALVSAGFILSIFSILTGEIGRVSVTGTYDPNDFALFLVMILPIVYFLAGNQYGLKKVGLYLIVILLMFTIYKTGSRGGFLGLLTVGFLTLARDTKKKLMARFLIITAFGSLFWLLAPGSYWHRLDTIFNLENDYNVTASEGRIDIWKRGLHLMLEHPFLGSGAGAFVVAEGETHQEQGGKWSAAHNSFIQIGVELGVGGLIFFVALIFGSIRNLEKLRKVILNNPLLEVEYLWLVNGIEISLIAFCVSGFFLSQAYSSLLYFLIANVVVLRKIELSKFGNSYITIKAPMTIGQLPVLTVKK